MSDGSVFSRRRLLMGAADLGAFLDQREVQFVAVCDVRDERREAVEKMADDKYGNHDCRTYWDMHELVARTDIDAVLVATGDRWHTMASIVAARGGRLGKLRTLHANTLDPKVTHGWLGMGTCSVRFEGEGGWIETGDTGKMTLSENLQPEFHAVTERGTDPQSHIRDFLNCVKSRRQPRANADAACHAHIACHAAYIAWQLGRKLAFDPAQEAFVGDAAANRMRSRALREPWSL